MHSNIHALLSLACFALVFNALYVSGIGSQPRSLSLSCGSENGGTDGDGRKWESDVKYIAGNYPHARAQYQDSSIVSEVPYMDARIFISEVTYNLPIMLKTRYWLRLYFYPSEYSGLNITNSYFSVVAGGVTLLNNFSASITAQALTQAYLIKEYSLAPMNHQILNVTFKPADRPDAFAFINAIELVPMTDLFGSGTMVGFSDQNFDAVSANLETMYRLNVAGQYISPTKDSGNLTRTWYNDAPYLFGAATGVNLQTNESFKVQYGELTESVAPPDKDHKTLTIVGTAGGVGFFFVAAACIAAYRRKKIIPGFDSHTSSWLPVYGNSHTAISASEAIVKRLQNQMTLWKSSLRLSIQKGDEDNIAGNSSATRDQLRP
uniref:Kinase family protein n=1 Tax=Populus alba TaxID=43335 RepID=A0A4U5MNV5_POPAL|nr:kinase family protein [Populus alba]